MQKLWGLLFAVVLAAAFILTAVSPWAGWWLPQPRPLRGLVHEPRQRPRGFCQEIPRAARRRPRRQRHPLREGPEGDDALADARRDPRRIPAPSPAQTGRPARPDHPVVV